MVATGHLRLSSTYSVASETKELNCKPNLNSLKYKQLHVTGGCHIRQHNSREPLGFLAWKFKRTTLRTAILKVGLVLHVWSLRTLAQLPQLSLPPPPPPPGALLLCTLPQPRAGAT